MSPGGFRSLTTRLIGWTLLAVGGVYAVTLVTSNALSRRMALAAAEREAESETESAASRIRDVLHAVEERTRVLAGTIEALDPDLASLDRLLRRFVPGNPDVWGAGIAFEPGAVSGRAVHVALYCHRRADDPAELASADIATGSYRYWEREWYAAPVRAGEPRWSEPHLDEGGGGVAMATYSVPLRSTNGSIRGVVTADLRLRWLDARVAEVELGRTGFGVIVSGERRVIAASVASPRPDGSARVALESLSPEDRVRLAPVVDRMLAGETGFAPVEVGGVRYRLTYRPIGHAGWSLATLYPESELLEEVHGLRIVQASLSLGGLALLALVVVLLSRRLTRPLQALSAGVGRMAEGDLDAALPEVETRDEVGVLTGAFRHMRDSLKAYIRDLQETTAAKERLQSELKVGRRIQADMLPRPTAGGPGEGYELAATLVPARDVGGDLFDHFRQGSRVFFLVGDVSGKGVPAALFMARTKTLFEALAAREADPGVILGAANHNLSSENEAGMYVTAICGSLDVESGELAFAIAGHDPPVLVPAEGEVARLEAEGGRVLGLIDGSDYPVNRLRLGHRDAILLYTDGVSEAQDAAGSFFELARILRGAAERRQEEVVGITAALLEAVRAFAGEAAQSDDITLMTLRYLARARGPSSG
jgi:sigma-B regulation protein RsbU (phosphoserine phosphatase)